MKVSIKQISEMTGFSPATISNALNYKKGVNAETSAKIWKAARDLGYCDENKIRKIRFVTFKRDGSIIDDTPFFPMLILGAEEECRTCGIEMLMYNLNKQNHNYHEQMKMIQNDKESAVILLGTELLDEDFDVIHGMNTIFLVIDYWKKDAVFDAMLINNVDSVRIAVDYLISKGHTEIGYLKGNLRIKPFRSREKGYLFSMQRAGLSVRPEYTVTLSTAMDGAYNDMKKYLAGKPKLPTAFFADNDMIALGAMRAIQEFGIRIPEDVSIIGFDDLPYSSISTPPLTTMRVPKQEMGRAAVRRIRDMMQSGDNIHLKMQACTQFVERASVADLTGKKQMDL